MQSFERNFLQFPRKWGFGKNSQTLIELKMWQSGHCDRAAHSQLKTRLSTKWPSFGALWTHVARVSTPWWIASFPNISFESIVTKSAARPRSWPNPRFRPWTFWGRNRLLFSGSNKTKKLFIPPLIIWVGWVKPFKKGLFPMGYFYHLEIMLYSKLLFFYRLLSCL